MLAGFDLRRRQPLPDLWPTTRCPSSVRAAPLQISLTRSHIGSSRRSPSAENFGVLRIQQDAAPPYQSVSPLAARSDLQSILNPLRRRPDGNRLLLQTRIARPLGSAATIHVLVHVIEKNRSFDDWSERRLGTPNT